MIGLLIYLMLTKLCNKWCVDEWLYDFDSMTCTQFNSFIHIPNPNLDSEMLPLRLRYDAWSNPNSLPLMFDCLSFANPIVPFPIVILDPSSYFIRYLLSFAILISIGFVIGLSKFLNFSSMKGVFNCFSLSTLFLSEFIFICSIKVYFKFSFNFDDYSQFGLCMLIFGSIPTSGLNM